MLVLAGAGSGKTRVLACRAGHLVHSGLARPWQILALTFTNKAAGELRSRVQTMVGDDGAQVVAGTFHGVFARIMRREGLNIGVDPRFTIVDADDRRRLIKAVLKELGIPASTASPAVIDRTIVRAKESMLWPEQFEETAQRPLDKIAAQVYPIYEARLRRMRGFDFDDLLLKPLEAFERYPDFLVRLQERFRYVLVDEFQDTNRVQYLLVRAIARRHRNLCAVGDDDQAIYGFRGATLSNLLDFEQDWPDVRIIRLEQNYRSRKPILNVAWSVIHCNRGRHPKRLWTDREGGQMVELIGARDDQEEALSFVGIMQDEHHLKGRPWSSFAVLYRTNAQSLPFERALRAAKMPYHVVAGLRFYERKEVKDLLAYLRLVTNPDDDMSLMRVINYPPRGIGEGLMTDLQASARVYALPLNQAILRVLEDSELPARRRKALAEFVEMMDGFRRLAGEVGFPHLAAEIVDRTGLRERLTDEEKEDLSRAESKLANLDSLLADIARYADLNPEATLEAFLEEVALVSEADDLDESRERVNLLTLHSAKGLEFPVVFIGGLEDGLLPLNPPDGSEADVEEERRLFYVGATRAMDRLVLGFAVDRLRWGSRMWGGPSRFLDEIPPELLEVKGGWPRASSLRPQGIGILPRSEARSLKPGVPHLDPDELRHGLLVCHPRFGLGVVVEFRKMALDTRVEVDFDEVGRKTLVLRYARLEVVR